jgi:hypothetical protein
MMPQRESSISFRSSNDTNQTDMNICASVSDDAMHQRQTDKVYVPMWQATKHKRVSSKEPFY